MIRTRNESAWKIYFLAWLDALEKLDVPVIELRHLQSTCIYQIRMPRILELLRFEEVIFLHPDVGSKCSSGVDRGGEWDKFSEKISSITSDDSLPEIKEIIKDFVPTFPSPKETDSTESYSNPGISSTRQKILEEVVGCWHTGVWGDGRKDLYHFISAAQRIKRQILTDRLLLFVEGGRALGLFKNKQTRIESIEKKRA